MSLQASQAACCVSVRVSRLCPRVASLSACRVSHRVSRVAGRAAAAPVVPIRPVNKGESVLLTVSVSTVGLGVTVPVSHPGSGQQSPARSCAQHRPSPAQPWPCLSPWHRQRWSLLLCHLCAYRFIPRLLLAAVSLNLSASL